MTGPVLVLPANDGMYFLDTDAFETGLGAVLSPLQNGKERVIAYASRTILAPKVKYETARKKTIGNGVRS